MRSSARQLELDGLFTASKIVEANTEFGLNPPNITTADTVGSSTPISKVPDFSGSRQAYALTSRMAGRINAASISETEYNKLLNERHLLVDKELADSLTTKEKCRLALVRWSLDRIEDAKYGIALDLLEDQVSAYEKLASDIHSLKQQLEKFSNRRHKNG